MENEICPVYVGFCDSDQEIVFNKEEVEAITWVSSRAFFKACDQATNTPFELFSPWSLMEGRLLKATSLISQLLRKPA